MNRNVFARFTAIVAAVVAPAIFTGGLLAQTPIANTVPFVGCNATNLNTTCFPTTPHTSWSGNPVTLKGMLTSSAFGTHSFTYDWNPGDGGAHCTGSVTNQYVVQCAHTYTGTVGTVFTAILTITDTTNSLVSPASNCPPTTTQGACYYTSLNAPPPNLSIEVNNAIDNGLWYVHSLMRHYTTSGGAAAGDWTGVGGNIDSNGAGDSGVNALECVAFENSGFLQDDTPADPYANDVKLCLTGVFDNLAKINIGTVTDPVTGLFNPDSNGNGIAVQKSSGDTNYQTGMMLDAIAAAKSPTTPPTTPIPAKTTLAAAVAGVIGSGPGGAYSYKDAVSDMVDDYAYCQNLNNNGESRGGWHYTCQEATGDNSVSQWAAIGIIPARRSFGSTIPNELIGADMAWLDSSFTKNSAHNGYFGYTSSSPIWGPFADTPSGLVQLAMNGKGRGTMSPAGNTLWDSAETYLRDNFGNAQSGGATVSMKDYYYGMFSFTKAMLLHDNSGTGLSNTPITLLQSLDDPGTCASPGVPVTSPGSGTGPCYGPIDWYSAQTSAFGGTDPTNGVARTILSNQLANGSWFGQNFTGAQNYFQTGISITMLNRTVSNPVPVACFTSNPLKTDSGGPVVLNGNCSSEQNPNNTLVSWQWDISGTGAGYSIGPGNPLCQTSSCSQIKANFTLPAGKTAPYNFPVSLLVTDSAGLTGSVAGSVVIANPPNPPNANAGGPYNFCPNTSTGGALIYKPFLVDGSKSTNPDQGNNDGTPGAPPSTITAYDWDFSCSGSFNSAHGSQVDATTAFDMPVDFGTSFNVCLRVTNNNNLAFPLAGLTGGLTSVASAQVTIQTATAENCTHCVQTLGGNAKAPTPGNPASIQLNWTDTSSSAFPIDHYNIYRSTSATFNPSTQVAGANSSPFLPAVQISNPAGATLYFQDNNVMGGTTYYYRVSPAVVNDTETCQGNITLAVTVPKGR